MRTKKKLMVMGFLFVSFLTLTLAAWAADWYVPGNFATIQEAIDSQIVMPGDRIIVGPGSYTGATVTKALEISGEESTIINSGPRPWPDQEFMAGLLFLGNGASGSIISHLKFEGVEFPVFSRGADDVIVENCTFLDPNRGTTNWHIGFATEENSEQSNPDSYNITPMAGKSTPPAKIKVGTKLEFLSQTNDKKKCKTTLQAIFFNPDNGTPVAAAGKSITFFQDTIYQGAARTDATGKAVRVLINLPGPHSAYAVFKGDNAYTAVGWSNTVTYTCTLPPPPIKFNLPKPLPHAHRGANYQYQCPTPTGGDGGPWSFALGTMGGFPPMNITLCPTSGLLSGLVTSPGGLYKFTICAVDVARNKLCKETSIEVITLDFVVTSISLNPSSPTANSKFTATVTVKNQGSASGNGKYLDVWANQPSTQSCGADGNARKSVGTLAAGGSKTFTFTNLSAGAAGTKTFRAFVDSGCATSETNEGNNQLTKTYTVGGGPDFVVTSISLNPSSPTANSKFTATVTVKNQGSASGDGKYLDVWVNQPSTQSCGADGDKYASVGTLAGGESKTFTFTNLPAGAAGTKTFRAFVDSRCATSEFNEGNNQLTKTYTVGGGGGGGTTYNGTYCCTVTTVTPIGTTSGPGTFSCLNGHCSDPGGTFTGTVDASGNFSGTTIVCQGCLPLAMSGHFSTTNHFTISGQSGGVSQTVDAYYCGSL